MKNNVKLTNSDETPTSTAANAVHSSEKMVETTINSEFETIGTVFQSDFPSPSRGQSSGSPSSHEQEISSLQTVPDHDGSFNGNEEVVEMELGEGTDSGGQVAEPGKYIFHLMSHHCLKGKQGRKSYKCDVCSGIYKHAFSLKRHFLRTHINYKYLTEADISNCNIILHSSERKKIASNNKISASETNRDKPKKPGGKDKASGMPGLYRCQTCGYLFDELSELKFHIANHPNQPNNKRFSCTTCNMTFSHRQNLVRHLSVHSGEKPYACRYCEKRFPTATNQKRHERIHEGVKPYVCQHCSSVFTQSGDLKKHIRKQHHTFFHPCAFCVKYFAKEELLEEHVISHGESLESNNKTLNKKNTAKNPLNRPSKESNADIQGSVSLGDSAREYKFACPICHKSFDTYKSMCHHRRTAHATTSSRTTANFLSISGSNSMEHSIVYHDDLYEGPPSTEAEFYADIAYSISDNLLNHLDGKIHEIQQPTPLSEDQTICPFGDRDRIRKNLNVQFSWSLYNFPPDFEVEKPEIVERVELDLTPKINDCGAYDLTKPKRNSTLSAYDEIAHIPQSQIMYNLALSPVDSEKSEAQYIDGVLDLSLPHRSNRICSPTDLAIKQIDVPRTFICYACGENMPSLEDMENHKINNHPNVFCTHLEIEGIKDVPVDLFKPYCSPVGALRKCPVPPVVCNADKLICTKCCKSFNDISELHSHILECGGHKENEILPGASKWYSTKKVTKKKVVRRGMKRRLEETPRKKGSLSAKKTKRELADRVSSVKDEGGTVKYIYRSKEVFICDGCDHKFNYQSALERHKKMCPQKITLRKPEQKKEVRQQHCCPNCLRSFTYLASLKKHVADVCSRKKERKRNPKKKMRSALNKSINLSSSIPDEEEEDSHSKSSPTGQKPQLMENLDTSSSDKNIPAEDTGESKSVTVQTKEYKVSKSVQSSKYEKAKPSNKKEPNEPEDSGKISSEELDDIESDKSEDMELDECDDKQLDENDGKLSDESDKEIQIEECDEAQLEDYDEPQIDETEEIQMDSPKEIEIDESAETQLKDSDTTEQADSLISNELLMETEECTKTDEEEIPVKESSEESLKIDDCNISNVESCQVAELGKIKDEPFDDCSLPQRSSDDILNLPPPELVAETDMEIIPNIKEASLDKSPPDITNSSSCVIKQEPVAEIIDKDAIGLIEDETVAQILNSTVDEEKEMEIKVESPEEEKGKGCDRKSDDKREPQSHSCPNCMRTYTYLANFKKHINEACPLRNIASKSNIELKRLKFESPKASDPSSPKSEEEQQSSKQHDKEKDKIVEKPTEIKSENECSNSVDEASETVESASKECDLSLVNADSENNNCLPNDLNIVDCSTSEENKSGTQKDSDANKLPEVIETDGKQTVTEVESAKDVGVKNEGGIPNKPRAKLQPYSCSHCHRIFLHYVKLLKHQISHKLNFENKEEEEVEEEIKKFNCSDCDKQFSSETDLNSHRENSECSVEEDVKASKPSVQLVKHKGGWPKGKSRKGLSKAKKIPRAATKVEGPPPRLKAAKKDNLGGRKKMKMKAKKKIKTVKKIKGSQLEVKQITKITRKGTREKKAKAFESENKRQELPLPVENEDELISDESPSNNLSNSVSKFGLKKTKRSTKVSPKKSALTKSTKPEQNNSDS